MLREPLGDPELRLAFWSPGGWVGESGEAVTAGADRVLTAVERDGRPAVAVVHDPELAEDPELVHAAGAMALLAWENAQLEAGWEDALRELSASRARIAAVADGERRAIERDLHDGVQQQLTAALMRLAFVRDLLPGTSPAQAQLAKLQSDLEATLEELRRLAHGIFPAPLAELGLVGALEAVARRSTGPIEVQGDGVARYPPPIESAVYFCCLEAVQNATKHTGPDTHISISLQVNGPVLRFEVRDDGPGFDPDAPHDGMGLRNLRDRLRRARRPPRDRFRTRPRHRDRRCAPDCPPNSAGVRLTAGACGDEDHASGVSKTIIAGTTIQSHAAHTCVDHRRSAGLPGGRARAVGDAGLRRRR